jgi:hypothetical protein
MQNQLYIQGLNWLQLKSVYDLYFSHKPYRNYTTRDAFQLVVILSSTALIDHILFTMFSVDMFSAIEVIFEIMAEQF